MLPKIAAALLSLLCLSSAAAASVAKLSFEKSRRCLTTDASLLPQKLTSKLQCAAFCSRLPSCNAFHFNKNTGQCFHGEACSQLEQWTADGDCDSYKYTDMLCGDCDAAEPVLTELKLKLFYKFSRSGLKNEVNPRQFCLTAHDVTVDAGGAHFEGNSGSYLSTETPGFWKLFEIGLEYSAFARVRHEFTSGYQYYHRYQQCDGDLYGNTFAKNDNYDYIKAVIKRAGNDKALTSCSPKDLPVDGLQREISVGLTFSGAAHQHFYKNGSFAPVNSEDTNPSSYSTDRFDCLNLGYSTTDSDCLKGSMFCYGLSSKALSLSEFQQLQQLCDQD